jgi:hypothetical protein
MNTRENDKEKFDTFDAMTKEEKNELLLIQKVRNNVKYFIGIDNIIKKIKSLIDNSEYVSFNNERNRKYISKSKPLFILKPNHKKIAAEYKLSYINSTEKDYIINGASNPKYLKDIEYLQNIVYNEIISPYSEYLMTFLKDDEKFSKLLAANGLTEVTIDPATIQLISIMSSTMFAIKLDLFNDRIYLDYAL